MKCVFVISIIFNSVMDSSFLFNAGSVYGIDAKLASNKCIISQGDYFGEDNVGIE